VVDVDPPGSLSPHVTQTEEPSPAAGVSAPNPRNLALGTVLATAATIGPLFASGILSLAIAHLYGPSGNGVMSLVMNLFDVALAIFTIGLSSGITYLVSRQEWSLDQAAREMRLASAVLGIGGAACALGFYFVARGTILRGVTPAMAIVSLVSLPFAIQWSFAAATALGRDRYEAYTTLELANAAIILVAGVGLAIPFGILGAVTAFAAAQVLTALIGAIWLRRETMRADDSGGDGRSGQLRRATKFGLQAWSANLLQLLNYRLDIFILSSVALRSTVGVYSIAVSVTALGWVLPNSFQTVLFPRVASLDAAAGSGRIGAGSSDAAAARAVRHSVLIVIPTTVLLVALVLVLPFIYGSAFERSVTLGFILIPGVAVAGVAKVASAVSSGRGFPRYALYTTALTVPATIVLYLLLIPSFHAVGAAAASTISYTFTTVLTVYYFERATSIKLRSALIPARSDLIDYLDALRSARTRLSRA